MTPERALFEHAVQNFDSLLSERFWSALADLFSCNLAEEVLFTYGPNKALVSINSEFFLGHYTNDALLVRVVSRDEDGWAMRPRIELDGHDVSARFTLSALYGISGTPVAPDPHRLLTHLLTEVESRVSLLRVHAWKRGELALVEEINEFERDYFVCFGELMAEFNAQKLLRASGFWKRLLLKVRVSWWG